MNNIAEIKSLLDDIIARQQIAGDDIGDSYTEEKARAAKALLEANEIPVYPVGALELDEETIELHNRIFDSLSGGPEIRELKRANEAANAIIAQQAGEMKRLTDELHHYKQAEQTRIRVGMIDMTRIP